MVYRVKGTVLNVGGVAICPSTLQQAVDKKKLTNTCVNTTNKMKTRQGLELVDEEIEQFFREEGKTTGNEQYSILAILLKQVRQATEAFQSTNLTAEERIRMLATTTFFCRGWRSHCVMTKEKHNQKGRKDDATFSENAFSSLELNLFQLLVMNAKFHLRKEWYRPFICNSQHCEEAFRKLRGLYHGDQSQIRTLSAFQRIIDVNLLATSKDKTSSGYGSVDCSNAHCSDDSNVKPCSKGEVLEALDQAMRDALAALEEAGMPTDQKSLSRPDEKFKTKQPERAPGAPMQEVDQEKEKEYNALRAKGDEEGEMKGLYFIRQDGKRVQFEHAAAVGRDERQFTLSKNRPERVRGATEIKSFAIRKPDKFGLTDTVSYGQYGAFLYKEPNRKEQIFFGNIQNIAPFPGVYVDSTTIPSRFQVVVNWLCDEKQNPVLPSDNTYFHQILSLENCIRGIDIPPHETWEQKRAKAIEDVLVYRQHTLQEEAKQKEANRKKTQKGVTGVECFDGLEITEEVSKRSSRRTTRYVGITKRNQRRKRQPSEADDKDEDEEGYNSDEEKKIEEAFSRNDEYDEEYEEGDSESFAMLLKQKQKASKTKRNENP